MKILIAISICILFAGCMPKIIPISGNMDNSPYFTNTDHSKDVVWDKIIDLFAQKGIPIKLIDRSSGLIISERSNFPVTIQLKDGSLKDPSAFILIPKRKNANTGKYVPAYENVTGEWNIRIKDAENGGTIININLVNMHYVGFVYNAKSSQDLILPSYKSTGVFEKIVTDFIK